MGSGGCAAHMTAQSHPCQLNVQSCEGHHCTPASIPDLQKLQRTCRCVNSQSTQLHKVSMYACSTSLAFFFTTRSNRAAPLFTCYEQPIITSSKPRSLINQQRRTACSTNASRLSVLVSTAAALTRRCASVTHALLALRGACTSTIRLTTASANAARAPAARAASACRTDCSAAATCWYASTACEPLLLEPAEGRVPARCGSAEGRRSGRTGPHWLASV